ncbi:hypothetical protein AJ78_05398 [Emergomyces pasteurianus Ep9510]|uniref:Spindle pole body-associated protein cut12 domain-containing protein n=1 Tax=Emergomyces pasteurianus Ep9510 TaxID=1447872 RepID=A0A1J9PCG1_9EURO|nr:hypothetical protein AJ78_05398 [Emergomyces pasteurianus Ep9510]
MLGWLAGSGRGEYCGFADDSKAQEPPETPAPVFAFRAFKSAFVGTPGPDVTDDELTVPIKSLKPAINRKSADLPISLKKEKLASLDLQPALPKSDEPAQLMASPTKSILLTPGTAATRRKTVSFGEGVVDNERKKSAFESTAYNGNISRQWVGNFQEGNGKSRSKFTQSLIEARNQKSDGEKKQDENDELFDIADRKGSAPVKPSQHKENQEQPEDECEDENEDDVTTNLNEPHSQSGIYWKSEFESYRAKTDREIKKLIQYRSVAKSYAKKKELEMRRLSDKLKREEAKVAEMELHVSKLAAGMANGTHQEGSNDDMFKELSEQTTLAVQYKRKVDSLRKALERHGVIDSDGEFQEKSTASEDVHRKLMGTEKAFERANSKLKDVENIKSETRKLQDLAEASERKATELQKENTALKQSLARFKQEMTNYEDRRKAKETRLKQKEQKLQDRVQEYKILLDEAKQHHQDAEQILKQSFAEEKQQMQDIIDSLRHNISIVEHISHSNARPKGETKVSPNPVDMKQEQDLEHARNVYSPRKGTTPGLRFTQGHRENSMESPGKHHAQIECAGRRESPRKNAFGEHTDTINAQSQAPRPHGAMAERATRNRTDTSIKPNEDNDEPLIHLEGSPTRPKSRVTRTLPYRDDPSIPPSSPPDLPSMENSPVSSPEKRKPKLHPQARSALSPRSSMVHISSNSMNPSSRLSSQYQNQLRRKASATRVLPRTSAKGTVATSYSGLNRRVPFQGDESILRSTASPASIKRDALPADRVAAAMRRLKLRDQGKGANADGKENIWSA